jgi:hypothetical protein
MYQSTTCKLKYPGEEEEEGKYRIMFVQTGYTSMESNLFVSEEGVRDLFRSPNAVRTVQ